VGSEVCDFAHRSGPGGNPCHLIGAIDLDSALQRGSPRDTTCGKQPLSFGMAEIVNLRLARKRAKRSKTEQHAAEQRVAHGASKSERSQAAADRDSARHTLDQHRIEQGDHR
jgi:DNA-binding helix-hairpin-helix protein with protein kinase domain